LGHPVYIFTLQVSKFTKELDLGEDYQHSCTIRVAHLPANVAFAAAQTPEAAENDAARLTISDI
jgi:hypothetical protein